MNKRMILGLLAAAMLTLGAGVAAAAMHEGMEHEKMGHEGMEHGMMEGMEHGEMAMHEGMMMLGKQSVDGVEAMIHLKDTSAAMAEMGMEMTHHVMISFTDEASGEKITEGLAAVKVTDPSGQTSEPVKMMGMGDGFGADVMLKEKGEYKLEFGTKLMDGNKRTFEASYMVE